MKLQKGDLVFYIWYGVPEHVDKTSPGLVFDCIEKDRYKVYWSKHETFRTVSSKNLVKVET